jgi:hypothetical protein
MLERYLNRSYNFLKPLLKIKPMLKKYFLFTLLISSLNLFAQDEESVGFFKKENLFFIPQFLSRDGSDNL